MPGLLEYDTPNRLYPMIRTIRALDALQQIANQTEAGRFPVVRGNQSPWRPPMFGVRQHGVIYRAVLMHGHDALSLNRPRRYGAGARH